MRLAREGARPQRSRNPIASLGRADRRERPSLFYLHYRAPGALPSSLSPPSLSQPSRSAPNYDSNVTTKTHPAQTQDGPFASLEFGLRPFAEPLA